MKEMKADEIKQRIEEKLTRYYGITPQEASEEHVYKAAVMCVRDILQKKRMIFHEEVEAKQKKQVFYLCMEFLVGKSLRNNLDNLGLTAQFEKALKPFKTNVAKLCEIEPDPGLGNGGLGRLASCFMDALATQNYPAMGYSIRYEYGLFKQKIVDGWQTELPDVWLPNGLAWLIPRTDEKVEVRFDGHIEEKWTENGLTHEYYQYKTVEAIPYDLMISGKDSKGVSVLRLWRAKSPLSMDMTLFSQGDYVKAMEESSMAEAISTVLYPADNHFEGKSLRLRQQYFLVSSSLQNILKAHHEQYGTYDNLHEKVAIHINDTHPALAIPELMRLLIDENGYQWDDARHIVENTIAYTNHTVMAEALETWQASQVEARMPRVYAIIKEMNQRFCSRVWNEYPNDWGRSERMAILSHDVMRMANLSIIGSHSVNGVAKIHSEILRDTVFKDFYEMYPYKFTNVTNGIAHRRWLCQVNPKLSALITECIGDSFVKDAGTLINFKKFENDASVLSHLADIKKENKQKLAKYVKDQTGIVLNTDSIFDVQIKRLHEYKRQLLNALRIIGLYYDLLDNPNMDIVPQTFIFSAKAAPSYYIAKQIIRLVSCLGAEIEKHPIIREKIRVIFLEDYNVSLAERIIPASEISEQISLAGKEASGTGNMKLMINGAVTLGTMDGANVEICQAVGRDNIFIFGLDDKEVDELWKSGYAPMDYYNQNEKLKRIVDGLNVGFNGYSFGDIVKSLIMGGGISDVYMCLADFQSYCTVHEEANQVYLDAQRWNRMSLHNIASAGIFAADRSIEEYANNIWHIEKLN